MYMPYFIYFFKRENFRIFRNELLTLVFSNDQENNYYKNDMITINYFSLFIDLIVR